jgi:hypothetical protein
LFGSNLIDPSDAPGLVVFEAHNVSSKLDRVDLDAFTNPASSAVAAQGVFSASRLRFGRIEASNMSSQLRLTAKQAFFTDSSLQGYGGRATGGLSFDLTQRNPTFSAIVRVTGLDMAHLLAGFRNGAGKMTGKMDGQLKFAGQIEHTRDPLAGIHGIAYLTVRNGQVPSLKLNKNLMELAHYNDLGPAAQDPSSFSSISADLTLANQRIASREVKIVGYGVDVRGSGTLTLGGSEGLDYHGVAEILTQQGFLKNLFSRLSGITVKDGKMSFPVVVRGTVSSPIFARESTVN